MIRPDAGAYTYGPHKPPAPVHRVWFKDGPTPGLFEVQAADRASAIAVRRETGSRRALVEIK